MKNLETRILELLSDSAYKPIQRSAVARRLKLTKKQLDTFHQTLDSLVESGKVREGGKGRLRLRRTESGMIAGIMKRTARGFGFVIPHDRTPELRDADIHIAAREMLDAHTGDEVLIRLTDRRRSGGQRCGRVEKIIERATTTFVGTYIVRDDQGFVRVDGTTFNDPILVGDPGAKGAREHDKVVLEMLRFPSHHGPGEGVLTKVLGKRGEPGVDTQTIIHQFGLPDEFPNAVLDDARIQAENFDESAIGDRRDLTKDTIITIDPVDARDFDDAISLTRSDDGHWHLGVHIADVAHFVPRGSVLDIEAEKRGTSVYLPQRVIPMLPEVISNGLASLQQGRLRYAKSVFIEFSEAGVPLHTDFANSAIKVTKRFAYEQVMPIVNAWRDDTNDDGENDETKPVRVTNKVRDLLGRMYELAMMLRRRRFDRGALELSLPETQLDIDKNGIVTGAHEAHHDESHEIIEEFMLAANVAVAKALVDRGLPFLRRTHGEPNEAKLKALAEFATSLGYELKKYRSRKDLQDLINRVRGTPHEYAVNYALLRSLKQAEYSPLDLGHFALSEDDYCHFTSPIRRYPDLMVHRLIDDLCSGRKVRAINESELTKIGKQCSVTERRAEKAERELKKVKLLRFMSEHVGETIDAVITGVESFGLFCQGVEVPAEGLLHITSLGDDSYDYDKTSQTLNGFRHGNQFRLGDRVRVEIVRVDIDRRELDFRLARATESKDSPTHRNFDSTKKKHESKPGKPKQRGENRGKKKRSRKKPRG